MCSRPLDVGTHSGSDGLDWEHGFRSPGSGVGSRELTHLMFKVPERRQKITREGRGELREGQGVVGKELINRSQFNKGASRIRADKAPGV